MGRRGARSALRVAAATIGLLVALCIPLGVVLLIMLNLDDVAGGVLWLVIFGAATLGIVPVIAGTVVATWNVDPGTSRGRTHFILLVAAGCCLARNGSSFSGSATHFVGAAPRAAEREEPGGGETTAQRTDFRS